ncbi:hypothetical protein GCM10022244_30790 [Streptomyces gulbargensis]|uniref:Calcium-binding protein n=1 Tax=Streptomyces gulbargensis TaxID=364901 RepID=A0ABP7MC56_9ACTN
MSSWGDFLRLRALSRARHRVTAAAVVGAALTASAVTTAVAPDARAATTMRITKVVVNGGKDIVLATAAKRVTVTATISEDSALEQVWLDLENRTGDRLNFHASRQATCSAAGTVKTCTTTLTLDPRSDMVHNSLAGPANWTAYAQAKARDGDFDSDYFPSVAVRRLVAVSGDAGPEPVRKGAALTVTGRLTAANWNTHSWTALAGRPVQLQFCKSPCTSYSTVRTVTSPSTGALRATVTASADGYWRWYHPAPVWATAASSPADHVDVR